MRRAAIALLLVACSGRTGRVEPGTIEEVVVARAVVEPRDGSASVTADRISRVTEVLVDVGDAVEAGQPLARIDASSLLEPIPIRAPIDGVVLARRADPGDDVTRADGALFEIADPRRARVRFELEDADAARVAIGMPVEITTAGGSEVVARTRVDRLSPGMTPRQIGAGAGRAAEHRLVRVGWANLPLDHALPLGRELSASLSLPPRRVDARVERAAVQIREGRAVVRVVGALLDEEVEVTLGVADATHVEVHGVTVGAQVRLD